MKTDHVDLLNWVTKEPNGCITLKKDAPFLRYPENNPNNKPQIKSNTLKGHNAQSRSNVYGIQKFAWVVLGKNAYENEQQYTTTCGNPMCMNPEHIVPLNAQPKISNGKPVNTGSLKKLREYQQVMRLSANGAAVKDIAEIVGLSQSCINKWRNQMLEDLFGEDYNWKDFQQARDIMDGMRYAEERRNHKSSEALVEMLRMKTTPRETMFEVIE